MFYSNIVPKTRPVWDIWLQMCPDLEHRVRGPTRLLKTSSFDWACTTSYWRSISTMVLSRTVSVIDGDFSRKSQIFPIPLAFCAPTKWFVPWNCVSALESQETRTMGLPDRQRNLTISSAIWIECMNVTDRRTDGQTDTGPQQRPRFRIASRGKNC